MNLLDQGVLYLLAVSLGLIISRVRALGRLAEAINFMNLWVALPGLFFVIYFARGVLSEDLGIAAFSAIFVTILVLFLSLASRGAAAEVRGTVVLNGAFVNAVNIPFPVLQVVMGTNAYAATFAATTSAAQILVAKVLQQHFGTGTEGGARGSAARIAPLIALGAGVLLHYIIWPVMPPNGLVESAGLVETLLIAAVFLYFGAALGATFKGSKGGLGVSSRPFWTLAITRCLIGPILGLLLALPLGEGSPVYLQMVFEAAMPPAILNTLILRVYGFDADSSAKWTTILTPINTIEAVALLFALGG